MNAPSFDALLGRLTEAEVRFVVVGGLALGAWGVVRGTKDCDIVPDPDAANLDMLSATVVGLGGHVQQGESLLGSEPSIAALLRGGKRAMITTELGNLDIVHGLAGVPPYEELKAAAVEVELAGVTLAICSIEHLRAMKRAAGRPRDLVDLDDLAAAQPEVS